MATREDWLKELLDGAEMPHEGHQYHLCYLQNTGFLASNLADYKKIVRNGKYVCKLCGRVAAKKENLCSPTPL